MSLKKRKDKAIIAQLYRSLSRLKRGEAKNADRETLYKRRRRRIGMSNVPAWFVGKRSGPIAAWREERKKNG